MGNVNFICEFRCESEVWFLVVGSACGLWFFALDSEFDCKVWGLGVSVECLLCVFAFGLLLAEHPVLTQY